MSKITVTTIAGQTSGSDANKVKIESGDTLEVTSNATVGGTFSVTGVTGLDGNVNIGNNQDISMDNSGAGQVHIDGVGYNGAIALNASGMNIYTNAASRPLIFGTDETERARIGTHGYTSTTQPSFRVGGSNANWVNVTAGNTNIIEFDSNVYHNIGSHYSTANDRFTAPIAGRYLIGYHAYVRNNAVASDGTSAYGYVRLKKNGNNISYLNNIFGYSNHTDNDIQMTLQTVIELAANDYMQVALSAVGGTVQHYGNSSQFYGHLLS